MAKIQHGIAIASISGKIGGTTYSRNADGAHARSHSGSVHPRTAKQRAVTSKFSQVTQAWRALTDAVRLTWYSLAISLGRRSGAFRLFTHFYLEYLHGGLTWLGSAPAHGSGFRVGTPSFTISRTPDALKFLYTSSIGANQCVMIFATPPQSTGIDFSLKGARLIKICTSADTSPVDLTTSYASVFGACFPAGSQICIYCHSLPTEPTAKIFHKTNSYSLASDAGNETATKLK